MYIKNIFWFTPIIFLILLLRRRTTKNLIFYGHKNCNAIANVWNFLKITIVYDAKESVPKLMTNYLNLLLFLEHLYLYPLILVGTPTIRTLYEVLVV